MTWLPNGKETAADMVRRFDRIPACSRQAGEQTDGHLAADSLCYAQHRAVKMKVQTTANNASDPALKTCTKLSKLSRTLSFNGVTLHLSTHTL